MVQLVLLVMVC